MTGIKRRLRFAAVVGAVIFLFALIFPKMWPAELIISVAPQFAAVFCAGAVIALGSRDWLTFGGLSALTGLVLLRLADSTPLADATEPMPDPVLKVVWANVFLRPPAVEATLRLAIEESADIVIFAEFPRRPSTGLKDKVMASFPNTIVDINANVVVFSRLDLTAPAGANPDGESKSLAFTVMAAGAPVRIVGAHTASPLTPVNTAKRNLRLGQAADQVAESPEALLVGDLNTTPWSPTLRDLSARTGLRRLSVGGRSTWLTPAPVFGLPIDHALVRGDMAARARVGPFIGSDHRPLIVELAPKPGMQDGAGQP